MSISINNSSTVLMARQALEQSNAAWSKSLQRLATGSKIVTAGDAPGMISFAMRLASQISGMTAAKQNANDALSLLQVADAALQESADAFQQIRDLAVDASTDTKTSSDRAALQEEVEGLVAEISRLASDTTIFSQTPLDGTLNLNMMVDPNTGQTFNITLGGATLDDLIGDATGSALAVSTSAGADAAVDVADTALDSISMLRSTVGALQNRLQSIVDTLDATSLGYTQAYSRVVDSDIAEESANATNQSIRQQASMAILAQANLQAQSLLKLLTLSTIGANA
ncbi:MAG: flagellin FliC [Magnetococcales bacterium]|nr:flagellin FliC [Magnetococcales bacterium]MBF0113961.1 flagellin FliC [Magnetococcales bacterium]